MWSFTIIDSLLTYFKRMQSRRKTVLLTGFAPFQGSKTNPSWEAVNFMDAKAIECSHNIVLWKEPIPVRYMDVDLIVPHLLDQLRPDLTIHVGLNEAVSSFMLETEAKKKGYYRIADEAGQYPALYQNPHHGLDSIVTSLDVKAIQDEFNRSCNKELHADISSNAGHYLCEYIYYTSLSHKQGEVLFVHVPLDKYTTEQLARGLKLILELCLKQLRCKPVYHKSTEK